MKKSRLTLTTLATVACLTTAGVSMSATPASAALASAAPHEPTVKVLADDLASPYQLAAAGGVVYFGDGSDVRRYNKHHVSTVVTGAEGAEVSGVALNKRGDLAWTSSVGGEEGVTASTLTIKPKRGATVTVDLLAYEQANNPDAAVEYGIHHPTDCQKAAFEPLGGASSTGMVDSHAYAVTAFGRDAWIVADAGGNDLLRVDRAGHVSTLAVLPYQPTTITADVAAGLRLPDCVVGVDYYFEPVPTDVEVSGGNLVVSLLPGGPEDPSLGARGSVYEVDPATGHATWRAGGFLGATNVAVGPHGLVYVAELFAGRISVIDHASVRKYADLPGALSLVWSKNGLYAGTLGEGDGSLVRIDS